MTLNEVIQKIERWHGNLRLNAAHSREDGNGDAALRSEVRADDMRDILEMLRQVEAGPTLTPEARAQVESIMGIIPVTPYVGESGDALLDTGNAGTVIHVNVHGDTAELVRGEWEMGWTA